MTKSNWYQFRVFNPNRKVHYYATYLLDQGGFGQVWSGVSATGLQVAIKIIKPSSNFLRDWQSWINEQSICLACLEHPHIITTFDQFCSSEGDLVLVMEKAAGSLDDLVSAEELATTFIGHKTSIPPELLVAGYSTHQSDIYQLGLVLLTLLTGSYPIPATATVEQIRQMILAGEPRQAAEGLINKHGKLAEIISIMLRRHETFRYGTVMDVWQELYDEFTRRNHIREIAESWGKQPPPKLPPWLRRK